MTPPDAGAPASSSSSPSVRFFSRSAREPPPVDEPSASFRSFVVLSPTSPPRAGNGVGRHGSSKLSRSALTSASVASSGAPCSALIAHVLASPTRASRHSACAFRNFALTCPGDISSAASQSNSAAFALSAAAVATAPSPSSPSVHAWFSRCPHASNCPWPPPGEFPRAKYAAARLAWYAARRGASSKSRA